MPPPEAALTPRWSLQSSDMAAEGDDSVWAYRCLPPSPGSEGRKHPPAGPARKKLFNGQCVNYPQDEPGVRHNWMSDAGRRRVTIKCIARKMEYNDNST